MTSALISGAVYSRGVWVRVLGRGISVNWSGEPLRSTRIAGRVFGPLSWEWLSP